MLVSREDEGTKINVKLSLAGPKILLKFNVYFACVKGVKSALKRDLTELYSLKRFRRYSVGNLQKQEEFYKLRNGARWPLMLDGDSLILLDVMKVVFTACFILSR